MSAARGRNAGREFLRERFPSVEYVQFVDGDTEVDPAWIARAADFLDREPRVGAVAGRLRERFRDRNAYHRLADMEFDTSVGERSAVGGIAMYRVSAFDAAGGFDPRVTTGEEFELCRRVTAHGFRIVALPETMAFHDIHMDSFGEWWHRTKRSGYSAAQHLVDRRVLGREVASMVGWGSVIPATAVALAPPTLGLSLSLFLLHGRLWRRVREDALRRGLSREDAALRASATVVGKVPEALGVIEYVRKRLTE
jgi:cellulose synthase/poly-beta-1,6-N-acetylglucosamine synthase-like glycosyltransferase